MSPEWVSAIAAIVAAVVAIISAIISYFAHTTAAKASADVVSVEQRVTRVTHRLEEFRETFSRPLDAILFRLSGIKDHLEEIVDISAVATRCELVERQADAALGSLRSRIRMAVIARYCGPDLVDRLMTNSGNPYDALYEALADIRATTDTDSHRRSLQRFTDAVDRITKITMIARDDASDRLLADLEGS